MLDSVNNSQRMIKKRKLRATAIQALSPAGTPSTAEYRNTRVADQSPKRLERRTARPRSTPSFRAKKFLILAASCIFLAACAPPTDLHLAVRLGNVDQVKRLLERGRDPNATDYRGETPLCWAAEDGRASIVKLLLEKGANPNLIVQHGALINEPYQPDIQDTNAATPLMLAAAGGHLEAAQVLLSAGADPNFRGPLGVTALGSAIRNKHRDLALLLLDAGANPNPKLQPVGGLPFMTPLENAVINEDDELIETLLNRGANVTDLSMKYLKERCTERFAEKLIQRDPRFEWLRECQNQSWLSRLRQRF